GLSRLHCARHAHPPQSVAACLYHHDIANGLSPGLALPARNRFLKCAVDLCLCHSPSIDHGPDHEAFAFRRERSFQSVKSSVQVAHRAAFGDTMIRNMKLSESKACPASIHARRLRIRSLTVGNKTIENVVTSIASVNGE